MRASGFYGQNQKMGFGLSEYISSPGHYLERLSIPCFFELRLSSPTGNFPESGAGIQTPNSRALVTRTPTKRTHQFMEAAKTARPPHLGDPSRQGWAVGASGCRARAKPVFGRRGGVRL